MKNRRVTTPKTHTIVKRKPTGWGRIAVEYYCTTCGRTFDRDVANKRCDGAKK